MYCVNTTLQITAEGEPDEAVERVASDSIKLYQVSDESGSMTTEEVLPSNGGGLTADLLNVRRRALALMDVLVVCACVFVRSIMPTFSASGGVRWEKRSRLMRVLIVCVCVLYCFQVSCRGFDRLLLFFIHTLLLRCTIL